MNKNVASLMDINFEVMVGKRNSNCISCGVGPNKQKIERQFSENRDNNLSILSETKYDSHKHIKGKDGKFYIS